MDKLLQALKSRTVLLAAGQAVVAVLIVLFTEADMAAAALAIKSVADIWLRADTTQPLSEK